jgi:hypothetical protein
MRLTRPKNVMATTCDLAATFDTCLRASRKEM